MEDQGKRCRSTKADLAKAMFNLDAAKSWKSLSKTKNVSDSIVCDNCKKMFANNDSLYMHLKYCKEKHTKGIPERTTKVVKKVVTEKKVTERRRIAAANYTCYACVAPFDDETQYFKHMSKFRYSCSSCDCHFDNRLDRKLHYCIGFLRNL
ncbi:PREDICTED: uncharacterized protein LOC108560017 [Nicrophorus vespilloides]|uniref:Uncharacterized protein LOC108560017 n=1 Tax=Nicrophorus vespilloides TaxID=110193 RepID=A0ABM1MEB9_NICVS|nr:PREDICTED: uncharacterized protein LOC108560017 [Nicrophorus vespilloides]